MASKEALAAMEKAKADGEMQTSAAETAVKAEISALRQHAAAKEEEAVRLILSELI